MPISKTIDQRRVKQWLRKSVLTLGLALLPLYAAADAGSSVEQGRLLATERTKGNCLACHAIADGVLPGNIGPPLVAMRARFPDEQSLFDQIWDATGRNPDSRMPPFGRHGILTEDEIRLIVDYLYTL
jgi:sulfur-oxidizing protein SoxX